MGTWRRGVLLLSLPALRIPFEGLLRFGTGAAFCWCIFGAAGGRRYSDYHFDVRTVWYEVRHVHFVASRWASACIFPACFYTGAPIKAWACSLFGGGAHVRAWHYLVGYVAAVVY